MANDTFFALLEQELAEHFSVRFRVKGTSMQPLLRNNQDEVQLVAYKGQELTPGAICLFKFKGRHILHRYLRREGELYYFQGDNVITNYEYCTLENIIGVVKLIYRDGESLPPDTSRWKIQTIFNRTWLHIRVGISSCVPRFIKDLIRRR